MTNELVAIVAVIAASSGAIINTVRGYWGKPAGPDGKPVAYSHKKLFSALITASFAGFTLVNLSNLPDPSSTGWMALIIGNLLMGFGVDAGLSALDK